MLEAFCFLVNVSLVVKVIAVLLFVLMPLLNVCPNNKSGDACVVLSTLNAQSAECDKN